MFRLLSASSIIALCVVSPAFAQDAGTSALFNLSYSVSAPNGGRDWGAVRVARFGAELPISARTNLWGSFSTLDRENVTLCTIECFTIDDSYLFQGGFGVRLGSDGVGRVVPFAKAGVTYERERGSGERWLPAVQGGLEWIVFRNLALRLGVESEWQFPARVALGVTFLIR
jgi:hypothetical protein